MNKIAVTPREGFTVKDHTGRQIPKEGARVDDSPVVRRRLREGLLVQGLAKDAQANEPARDGDGDEDGIDLEKMTIPELKDALTGAGVEFEPSAKKADLLNLLVDHLEAQDGE